MLPFVAGWIFMTSSCKKLIDISTPKNQLTGDKVFADSTNADAAIIGIYNTIMNGETAVSFSLTSTRGLAADELTTTLTNAYQEFFNNEVLVTNTQNAGIWTGLYKQVYAANAIIEGVEASPSISDNAKAILTGEAKCIRAYLYYQLLNSYGGIPLVLKTDYTTNARLPRATEEQVLDQILNDLRAAQGSLSKDNFVRWRANYYAATAMLARVHLFRKNYREAITEAKKVINSGNFILQDDLNKVFTADSKEGIWSLVPDYNGRETFEGFNFIPSNATAVPKYALSSQLLNSFTPPDKRSSAWTQRNTINGQNYYYPFKYKKSTRSGPPTEHYLIIRSAELYLILAEACAALGESQNALDNINIIRHRSGLSDFSNTDVNAIKQEIMYERKLELFCEQGARWIDLKRTGTIDAVLTGNKQHWSADDKLFPIPKAETDANSQLQQNPGY